MPPLPCQGRSAARALLAAVLLLPGCGREPAAMLGSLEWDLVRLTAPAAERIEELHVVEGEAVDAGQPLLTLDASVAAAHWAAARAEALQAQRRLQELRHGPRDERLAAAAARVARAASAARQAEREFHRVEEVAGRGLLPRADLDRARAARDAAAADLAASRAELRELEAGTRNEEIDQAEAALAAADARAEALGAQHGQLSVRAPRPGVVESLPFEAGDRPPQGATLATLRIGAAPYLRLYVPQPLRARVQPGTVLQVRVEGDDQAFTGRVRSVASEPSFTPYFALAGEDASRLVYLAEVELGSEAARLPAGLPASAWLPDDGR